MLKVDVRGISEAKAKLAAMGPGVQAQFEHGIADGLRGLMIAAQEAVPIYSGSLHASAFVKQERSSGGTNWTFGYSAPYAAFVHDHPNAHANEDGHPCACYATIHRPRPGMMRNGQGYKWLEKTAKAHGDLVSVALAKVLEAIRSPGSTGRPAAPAVPGGAAVGALPKSAHAARLTRNRALIESGRRNAGGGGGGRSGGGGGFALGSSKEKKTKEEREAEKEQKRREAEARRAQKQSLREYVKAALELARRGRGK